MFINPVHNLVSMGLLNRLFGSESVARDIETSNIFILSRWDRYLAKFPEKSKIISGLAFGSDMMDNIIRLDALLKNELVDVGTDERSENNIISDLESLEHDKRIARVDKLEQTLKYVETKFEYVHNLLEHLHKALAAEMNAVAKLLGKAEDPQKLIEYLKKELLIEQKAIEKIGKLETFNELFPSLVKGEHIVRRMEADEKRLVSMMQKGFMGVFSNEITEGITYEWAIQIFNAIEDKVHEAVEKGIFPGYHSDIDYEYVNRPEFVQLVREIGERLRKVKTTDKMLNSFVNLFREWFNHIRE